MNLAVRDKKRLVLYVLAWLITAIWMAMIFVFSAQPDTQSAELSGFFRQIISRLFGAEISQFIVRKAAHTFEYFLLSVCVFHAAFRTWNKKKPYFSFFFTVIYALTDEFHQYFIPGRACRLADVLIDSAGAASGILLCLAVLYFFSRLKRRKGRSLACKKNLKK